MGRHDKVSKEERELICRLRAQGLVAEDVVEATGRSRATVDRVVVDAGGLPPRERKRRRSSLSLAEREEISRGLQADEAFAPIARRLGRATSTISREVGGVAGRSTYRAWTGEKRAHEWACRPKVAKLAANRPLRAAVEALLKKRWSPQQIARHLKAEHPEDPEMQVSHETIYTSLFVQGRGALRKELTACLRSGRAQRRPARRGNGSGQINDMVLISERPAEVEDRAVPGHWEGDLIMGAGNRSAIGTLVERSSRYVMLLHLPEGHGAEAVRIAMTAKIKTLPEHLVKSLTWDQGKELAEHVRFTVDTGVAVYFCHPHSPWQRGSNENTNGLLRQYFPKGTDLSVFTKRQLDRVAHELNDRPRLTLGDMKPSQRLAELVALAA